jgi:hypothetical protein
MDKKSDDCSQIYSQASPWAVREKLLKPAMDIRSLLRWGYPKFSTIRFVADHFQLNAEERNILTRVILPPDRIVSRVNKKVSCKGIKNRNLLLDGYNVLLTTDSFLKKEPMWFCDDSFIRDTRFYFQKSTYAKNIEEALDTVLAFFLETAPMSVTFLLDSQISRSGELAGSIRRKMEEFKISGSARTSKVADFELKNEGGNPKNDLVVLSSDGIVIDAVRQVFDLPGCLMEKMEIEPIKLY